MACFYANLMLFDFTLYFPFLFYQTKDLNSQTKAQSRFLIHVLVLKFLMFKTYITFPRVEIKVRKKPKEQSSMDNPERLATLGTQDTRRRQTKQKSQHKTLKRLTTRTPTKKGGV